ncbi:MAG: hypothetical protein LBU32_12635 [Clostridiales bacterium]|jgi:hypothetical protein|nr:hypothetical protein [Clostridiales bacterium]
MPHALTGGSPVQEGGGMPLAASRGGASAAERSKRRQLGAGPESDGAPKKLGAERAGGFARPEGDAPRSGKAGGRRRPGAGEPGMTYNAAAREAQAALPRLEAWRTAPQAEEAKRLFGSRTPPRRR